MDSSRKHIHPPRAQAPSIRKACGAGAQMQAGTANTNPKFWTPQTVQNHAVLARKLLSHALAHESFLQLEAL